MNKYEYRFMWSEEDKAYIARVLEFPSLAAHGDTAEEAIKEIQSLVASILEDMKESGEIPPEPYSIRNYSGKLNVRMPKDLHQELAKEAARQEISLNQLILSRLSRSV